MAPRWLPLALSLFALHAIPALCGSTQKKFAYDPDKKIYYQNGKTKSTRAGLGWLARYQLPVPSSAYSQAQVDLHKQQHNYLQDYQVEVEYLQWYADYVPPITWKQFSTDPTWGYCNTTFITLKNGTWLCQDDAWVGIPTYIEQDLNEYGDFLFSGNSTFSDYGTSLVRTMNETKSFDRPFLSHLEGLQDRIQRAYYAIIGDYLGVGFQVSCKAYIEETLNNVSQFDQAGWQAATTLMALTPVLLTFGNLFVARSSEAFGTSFLIGIMSAVFSLGLPVRSISGIRDKQRINVSTFSFYARQNISTYGKPTKRLPDGNHSQAKYSERIEDLQKWSQIPKRSSLLTLTVEEESSDCAFGSLRKRACKWQRRAHMWHVSAVIIAAIQAVLFLFAIGPLFVGFGTPLLLFDCNNYWTSLWLIVSAAISAAFRFLMWEKGAHERVKIYALSDASKEALRGLTSSSEQGTADVIAPSIETRLPPLHMPLQTAIGHALYRQCYRLWMKMPRSRKGRAGREASLESLDSLMKKAPASTSIIQDVRESAHLVGIAFVSAAKAPGKWVLSGVSSDPKFTTAMRFRPMIVLMHLSTEGRNPLTTLFTGFIEGIILILLTIFMGASWGGNLLVMCYVMAVLLVTITLGRALALWYVYRSAKLFGLHVIETQSPRQIIGCLRIICAMKDVLVLVNGAWYFEGYLLNEIPEWTQWRKMYEGGDFDEDNHQPNTLPLHRANIGSITRQPSPRSSVEGVAGQTSTTPGSSSPVLMSRASMHIVHQQKEDSRDRRGAAISSTTAVNPSFDSVNLPLSDLSSRPTFTRASSSSMPLVGDRS